MPINHDILTLFDVPGLEQLRRVCDEFKVDFIATGGLVRNLAHAMFGKPYDTSEPDLFSLTPFTSDIDLIHTGDDSLTPQIMNAILSEIPAADCFRWQVRSVSANAIYWEAMKANSIIPVNLMSLSTNGQDSIRDPWNAITRDILGRNYRFIRNGFYEQSPLYRSGRDLELFSVLLYARVLLDAGIAASDFQQQQGLDDARQVIRDAINYQTATALQESAQLRARMKYLFGNIFFAASSANDFGTLLAYLGLEEFFAYLESSGVSMHLPESPDVSRKTEVFATTTSAHVGGDFFRVPDSNEPWAAGQEANDILLDALQAVPPAPNLRDRKLSLGAGQEVLLASPPMPINYGVAPSSGLEGTPRHEFAHFSITLPEETWESFGRPDETDMTAILAFDSFENGTTTYRFFPVPTVCDIREWSSARVPSGKHLRLRVNCWGLLEQANRIAAGVPPRMRVFVIEWKGF